MRTYRGRVRQNNGAARGVRFEMSDELLNTEITINSSEEDDGQEGLSIISNGNGAVGGVATHSHNLRRGDRAGTPSSIHSRVSTFSNRSNSSVQSFATASTTVTATETITRRRRRAVAGTSTTVTTLDQNEQDPQPYGLQANSPVIARVTQRLTSTRVSEVFSSDSDDEENTRIAATEIVQIVKTESSFSVVMKKIWSSILTKMYLLLMFVIWAEKWLLAIGTGTVTGLKNWIVDWTKYVLSGAKSLFIKGLPLLIILGLLYLSFLSYHLIASSIVSNVAQSSIKVVQESPVKPVVPIVDEKKIKDEEASRAFQLSIEAIVENIRKRVESLNDEMKLVRQSVKAVEEEHEKGMKSVQIDIKDIKEEMEKNTLQAKVIHVEDQVEDLKARIGEMQSEEYRSKTVSENMSVEKLLLVLGPYIDAEITRKIVESCKTHSCPDTLTNLETSRDDIELMIKRAIATYDADKTGMPDLALESAGGSILSTRCTISSDHRNSVISLLGFRIYSPVNTPRVIIQPGVVPGECWAFDGSVGDVVIKLALPTRVTGFTLEHMPKRISRNLKIDTAPKDFQVIGLQSENDVVDTHDYGTFTYMDNGEPMQYFPVSNYTDKYYPIVELKILSNHGNIKNTCVYRFRVHGHVNIIDRSQSGR